MFLSIQDVAQRTTLSTSSIRRLCQKNSFPQPIQLIGRRRVWSATAVNSWIQEKLGTAHEGGRYE